MESTKVQAYEQRAVARVVQHTPPPATDGYITRPFSKAEFLTRIDALLRIRVVQEALRESEARYRALVEQASDGVVITGADGCYLSANPSFLQMVGYSSEELSKLRVHDVVEQGRLAYLAEHLANVSAGTALPLMEWQLLRKDRTTCPVEVSAKMLLDGHILAMVRDISVRKQADEEKANLEVQLQQAQKMESVGRLAGGVAHDFNNMLSVIQGYAELALETADPNQSIHGDLVEILQAARRSADLTRQLLAFARQQAIAPKVLDLNDTVTGMLKLLRRLIGENVALAWVPNMDLWTVKMDPSQIDQILANLCVNARDAIDNVGQITITAQNCALDMAYCADHAGVAPGQYVRLTVSDNGSGMEQDTLTHIYEPFFTTKSVGQGTGLGLATVYGIVKQNNGFIDVDSKPGQGTTFTLYLPRYEGKDHQSKKEAPSQPPMGGHETILLVEDEPTVLKLTTTILEKHGYTVLTASTPGNALRLAGAYAGEIHLLMTDVVMPQMNGPDLAAILISLYPRLKRLFMSGCTANVVAHHGVLQEDVAFIQKPFSIPDLAAKVREALGR
jgi:PAS domain S-box-containing protein